MYILTLCHLAVKDFRARTAGLHVALGVRNSGAKSGRELFKGSKDVASLPVCTQNIFWLGSEDFL